MSARDRPMPDGFWKNSRAALWNLVWEANRQGETGDRSSLIRGLRIGHMVIREVAAGQLTLCAMSLVYTTLLSLIPLLAVSFSVLKGFDVHDQLEPTLLSVLSPLGEKAGEISTRILGFVENVQVGLLGSVGLGLLLYTVISLVQKVERAFNYAWRVHRGRPWSQRITDYLSVLLVGPVCIFTSMGLVATLASSSVAQKAMSYAPLGWLAHVTSPLLPIALIIGAFTFAYMFLPNTRVRFRPALVGGLVAGLLWHLVGWGFATFVVTSTSTTQAIYSSFGILIIFMLWLYLAWLTLLIGATVAFYAQHPEYLGLLAGDLRVSSRMKERLTLQCVFLIAQRHFQGSPALTTYELVEQMGIPLDPANDMLSALHGAGVLVETDKGAWVPGRDLSLVRLNEVLNIVRLASENSYLNQERLRADSAVDALLEELARGQEAVLAGRTLRDLVMAIAPQETEYLGRAAKEGLGGKHKDLFT